MQPIVFVSCCLGIVAICTADVLPMARSAAFKDEDYTSGSSSAGGLYPPAKTEVRYPVAAEESPSVNDQESHPYAQAQVKGS